MDEKINRIVNHYSFEQQREIFIEECAEAIQAAQKCKRANSIKGYETAVANLTEEVADVLIMARQMRYFLAEDKVDKIIRAKLERQINRINEEV